MSPKFLLGVRSFNKTLKAKAFENYQEVLGKLFEVHGHHEILNQVQASFKAKDWKGFYDAADSLSAQQYSTATQHFVANQFALLIKKYPWDQLELDPEGTALKTFLESEAACAARNYEVSQNRLFYSEAFSYMRGFILSVIGESPDLDSILEECDFGPGANVGVTGNATNIARKIDSVWSVTPSALQHAALAVKRNHQLSELFFDSTNDMVVYDDGVWKRNFLNKVKCVSYNKISFVPKTAKTHRSIAVEPVLNGFIQKGIDTVLRRKLLKCGVNLSDQTINQRMALSGSADEEDSFVTIDLKSASDSISTSLVKELLPPDWFDLLDQTRSKSFKLGDQVYPYSKFCSMGNGFCFPLQSLLFTAACIAVGCRKPGHEFHVYGDDIIVRKVHADPLIRLLADMGFTVNKEKSFLQGPFRESCGADYFDGKDVRPFTLDFALDSLENIIKFQNLTRRNEQTSMFFSEVREFIKTLVPRKLYLTRPTSGPENTAITCEMDEFMASPYAVWSRDLQTWTWLELQTHAFPDKGARGLRWYNISLVLAALRGNPSNEPFTVRRKTRMALVRTPKSARIRG